MKIASLHELKVWQHAKQFADAVSAVLSRPAFRRDRRLHDQLDESSLSVLSNISEGFGQRSDRLFANHLSIARGSNNEAIAQLAVACTRKHITVQEYAELEQISEHIGRMLTKLIAYLDSSNRPFRA